MANDLWSERWWGDWELVLLNDGHVGEALVVLLVLVLWLVLLACRWQLRGKRKMGVDRNMTPLLRVSLPREI